MNFNELLAVTVRRSQTAEGLRSQDGSAVQVRLGETVNAPVSGRDEPVNGQGEPVNRQDEPVNAQSEPVNGQDEPVNAQSEPVNGQDEPVEELRARLLSLIRANPALSYDELAQATQRGRSTIMRHIAKLKAAGRLRRVGSDKTGHWEVLP